MSRNTRMAIEHSSPTPQGFESGGTARYEIRVLSILDREAWRELTPSPTKLPGFRNGGAGGVAKPFKSAILPESVRVDSQS